MLRGRCRSLQRGGRVGAKQRRSCEESFKSLAGAKKQLLYMLNPVQGHVSFIGLNKCPLNPLVPLPVSSPLNTLLACSAVRPGTARSRVSGKRGKSGVLVGV